MAANPYAVPCPACDGSGRSKTEATECSTCKGTKLSPMIECPACDGTGVGRSGLDICRRCRGLQMVDPRVQPPTPLLDWSPPMLEVHAGRVSEERAMQAMPRRIAQAVFLAMVAIGDGAKKTSRGAEGYAYASAETLLELARPALLAEGVVVQVVDVQPEGERLAVTLQLEHVPSGEVWQRTRRVAVVEDGRGRDKAESAAETLALGYFLRGVLAIPRHDVDVEQRPVRREEQAPTRDRERESAPKGGRAPRVTNPDAAVSVLLREVSGARSVMDLDAIAVRLKSAKKRREVGDREFREVADAIAEARPRAEAHDAHEAAEGAQSGAAA